MRLRSLLPAAVAIAAAASVSLVPVGSASAAANGKVGIHTVTKSLLQGETSRVKGKVVGARAGVAVTIQQRQGGSGKKWGSGRQVKTDSNGKFTYDRVIKGKYTRDYRACIGPKNKRQCSLRARIEVRPKTTGIFVTQAPASVTAGAQITAKGNVDAALANRSVTLEQFDKANLAWKPLASAAITPGYTFDVTGTPILQGKAQTFRLTSGPVSGRPTTVSRVFASDVYGWYSLTTYAPVQGGFQQGPATYTHGNGQVVTYPAGSVIAASQASLSGTANLAGSCDRFKAEAFLDSTTAVDTDKVNGFVTTRIGAVATEKDAPKGVRKGDPLALINVDVTGAETLELRQTTASEPADRTSDPLWFGNPMVSCAY
jgi:hypothetical protein